LLSITLIKLILFITSAIKNEHYFPDVILVSVIIRVLFVVSEAEK